MTIHKNYKITNHAKSRMRERTPYNHKDRTKLFKDALHYGKNPHDIKDEKLRSYLYSKRRWNSYVKLFKNYIFVYSKNNKHLYTVYPIPKKYLENGGDENAL